MSVIDIAREAAESIRAAYWPHALPVRPEMIARRLSIAVTKTQLPDDYLGLLVKRPGEKAQIFLDASESEQRNTVTCAHELGHFVERTVIRATPAKDYGFVETRHRLVRDIHEDFADAFALALLMPDSYLESQQTLDPIAIASALNLPLETVQTRLLEVGAAG